VTVYVPVKGLDNNDQPIEIPDSYANLLRGKNIDGGTIRICDNCGDLFLSILGDPICGNCN